MGTITLGSDTFTVYGTSTGLATYANGSLTFGDAYTSATATTRARALVEATRLLDRQAWQGDKTDSGQALAWPRTGVTDRLGNAVDDSTIPDDVITAAYELALAALVDAGTVKGTSTGSNIQSVNAQGVSVSFFAPVAGGRFPARVMELVGQYLGGSATSTGSVSASGLAGSYASGTDGESAFDDDDVYGMASPV